jgi:hypothetical protein
MDIPIIYNPTKLLWLPENYDENKISKSFRLLNTDNNLEEIKILDNRAELIEDNLLVNEIINLEKRLEDINSKYLRLLKNYNFIMRANKIYEKLLENINKKIE